MAKINVYIDTREKKPFRIVPNEFIDKVISKKVDVGDYTIEGLEHLLALERKRNSSEIAINIFEKRFYNELEKMSKFKYKFIVCEFTIKDVLSYPVNSGMPARYYSSARINGNFIMSKLLDIQINYGIHILFCGLQAQATTLAILKKVAKLEGLI